MNNVIGMEQDSFQRFWGNFKYKNSLDPGKKLINFASPHDLKYLQTQLHRNRVEQNMSPLFCVYIVFKIQ